MRHILALGNIFAGLASQTPAAGARSGDSHLYLHLIWGAFVLALALLLMGLVYRAMRRGQREYRARLQAALDEARGYGEKLMRLHEVGNELTTAASLDELTRRSIELGREKLGFDRLGIWLHDETDDLMVGTWGVDLEGKLEDSRRFRHDNWIKWQMHVEGGKPFSAYTDREIRDHTNRVVGHGMHSVAGLWDGAKVIGFIATDNYVKNEPITESMNVLLAQYASTIGHLISRKRGEEELRESRERLEMAMLGTGDSLWDWDMKSDRVRLDPAWLEAIGREEQKDRVPLDWWLSLMEGESRNKVRDSIDEHLANRSKHAEIEYEVRAKTGGTKWFWWRGKCLSRDEAGVPLRMIGSQRDITERKRLDEERLNLEEQVRHAQKLESLGVLAGGIAHDFNNLLMGILGNADLALYEISPVSPVCANLREIETAAKRAADLCRQMLAYSGKGAFLIATVRINEIIQEMAHLLEVSISKKVALRFEFAKDLPPIECDVTQFRQIVMNLITNASDAIGDDNGIITVRTGLLHCDRDYLKGVYVHDNLPESDYVYLEVSDSGCGMDRATLERIFEPFFTTKFTGRGLGMSAVLGIVRSHGGAIKIYSEPGKGSMFRVLFPPSSKRPQSAVEGFVKSDGWKGSGRVLLVDDEETILTVGTRMLNLMGFEVLPARDGIEALEVFKANADTIRCVILDLTMPRMSGEETFRALNALDSRVPILLSSGYTEQEVNGRFSGKRVAGFIQKPYQYHSLLARMRQALDPAKEGDTDPDEMERS